jgi:hypothetical protein
MERTGLSHRFLSRYRVVGYCPCSIGFLLFAARSLIRDVSPKWEMRIMKCMRIVLSILLVFSLVGSVTFLAFVLVRREAQWQEVSAELILVIVLAVEGLFAISHLAESRAERQAEALRDFMHDFASKEALEEREDLFTSLPWGHDFGHIPNEQIEWISERTGSNVVYKLRENANCQVEVTMKSDTWRKIQRLSDQYHFAGLSCRRGYMDIEDLLNWIGPQPLRWWRRLGGIIQQERTRRGTPSLFKGFEDLATAAQSFFRDTIG